MSKPNILVRSRKNKAQTLINDNRLPEAELACMELCRQAPADAESWTMLAYVQRRLGLYDKAESSCRRALALAPGYARAHQVLGTALQCFGRLTEALTSYREAVRLQPDHAEARYLFGNALREAGQAGEAVIQYRKAIQLQPDFVEALGNLGAVLTVLGDMQSASDALNRAIRYRPDSPEILCNLGHILQREGRFDEALEKYRRALNLHPRSLEAMGSVANLLEKTNHIDEANALVASELPLAPNHPGLLLAAAKLSRRAKRSDEAIAYLERALKQSLSPEAAGEAHLHLGQLYDRQGMSELAFSHLVEGNQLTAQVMSMSDAQGDYLERVVRQRSYLCNQLLAQADRFLPVSEMAPVFLIGFPRSGTTLLEQILDSHPRLQALEEKGTVSAMLRAFESMSNGNPEALAELSLEQVRSLQDVYYAEVARYLTLEPGNILIDKMPLNTVNVHLIWRIFPNARFILAIRHPCDACFSCFMQNFLINEAMASFFTLESAVRVYDAVMQTWQQVARHLPLSYHQVRYEDLVSDFEGETRALLNFLGVGWDERVRAHTDHAIKRGTINTPSYHQVTQPIYQHAKYRWKRYATHFEPLMPLLAPHIEYFGYTE